MFSTVYFYLLKIERQRKNDFNFLQTHEKWIVYSLVFVSNNIHLVLNIYHHYGKISIYILTYWCYNLV